MKKEFPITVAVVDDNALIRESVKFRLKSLGYNVVMEAENGQEFLDKLHVSNMPDICVLDINMASPIIKDGHIYGTCANGELRCIDVKTGDQLWEDFSATGGKKTDCGTAFIIPQGDRYILFNDQGELILAHLSPKGYTEIDRAKIIDAVEVARGRTVVWSHPAFANRCVFVRNFKEIICVSLTQEGPASAIKALSPPA